MLLIMANNSSQPGTAMISEFMSFACNDLLEPLLQFSTSDAITATFVPEVDAFLRDSNSNMLHDLCSVVWEMKHSEATYSFVEAYVNYISDPKNNANTEIISNVYPEAIDGIRWASSFPRYARRVWSILRANTKVFEQFVTNDGLEKLMSHPMNSETLNTAVMSLAQNLQYEYGEEPYMERRCAQAGVIEMCLVALHGDDLIVRDALNLIFNLCVDPVVRSNCMGLVAPIMSKFCHPDAVAFNGKF